MKLKLFWKQGLKIEMDGELFQRIVNIIAKASLHHVLVTLVSDIIASLKTQFM